ncbi:MAG: hypothetical protein R3F30_06120 [Planctomycetota bacterium]
MQRKTSGPLRRSGCRPRGGRRGSARPEDLQSSGNLLPSRARGLTRAAQGHRQGLPGLLAGLGVLASLLSLPSCSTGGEDGDGTYLPSRFRTYDVVYVRSPRQGEELVQWPEVRDPILVEPGTDLMLIRPDGREEVLVAGGNGAAIDPFPSFDAQWVYYSFFPDVREVARNRQRRMAPSAGSDIYRINVKTREVQRLTHQEWTPNTGVVDWSRDMQRADPPGSHYIGHGVFNLGPCPLPGGRVAFVSSRNSFKPNKGMTYPNLQLFVMDEDGRNVECIGHINLGSALHPTVLADGRLMFSSYEAQGVRDSRNWALWQIRPDGTQWGPLMSAFHAAASFHFQAQTTNGDVVVEHYYNQNSMGLGTLLAFPSSVPPDTPGFGPADPVGAPWSTVPTGYLADGRPMHTSYSFAPWGLRGVTPFAHGTDNAASREGGDGTWLGKVGHPAAAPAHGLLVTWSSGPVSTLLRPTNRPQADGGVYLIPDSRVPVQAPGDMVLVKDDPRYNEMQPRALVPYRQVMGIDEPVLLTPLANDGSLSAALPAGTPFGLVGTSSFYKRDVAPGVGPDRFSKLDPFNSSQNKGWSNWGTQGAMAGLSTNADIWAVRILTMEPTSNIAYGPKENFLTENYHNHASERLRILGEIPLRKFDGQGNVIRDPENNPDTSFLARIPADVPFTFQTIDKDGLALDMSQTWHQVRPGEIRNDCGGCHAHSQRPLAFDQTAAARKDYTLWDLTRDDKPYLSVDGQGQPIVKTVKTRAIDVEYYRDIRPILDRSCVPCHTAQKAEAGLRLDDMASGLGGFANSYNAIARDEGATQGYKPVINAGTWRVFNASRWVRKFQARRSLLVWKVFGRRLDGWKNEDHPTESVPGDPKTLPSGTNPDDADLDYTGTIMPPPGAQVPPLSEDEKRLIARWVDLGCPTDPVDTGRRSAGWFCDDLRPTLTVQSPRPGRHPGALTELRFGAYDYYTDLDVASLSVRASFAVNGRSAGSELADLFAVGDHVWSLKLSQALQGLADAELRVRIKDKQGNWSEVVRSFSN